MAGLEIYHGNGNNRQSMTLSDPERRIVRELVDAVCVLKGLQERSSHLNCGSKISGTWIKTVADGLTEAFNLNEALPGTVSIPREDVVNLLAVLDNLQTILAGATPNGPLEVSQEDYEYLVNAGDVMAEFTQEAVTDPDRIQDRTNFITRARLKEFVEFIRNAPDLKSVRVRDYYGV